MSRRFFWVCLICLALGEVVFAGVTSEDDLLKRLEGKTARYAKVIKSANSDPGIAFSLEQDTLNVDVISPASMSYEKQVAGSVCLFVQIDSSNEHTFCYVSPSGHLEEKLTSIVLAALADAESDEAKHNLRLLASLFLNRQQPCPPMKLWRGLKPGLN
jgi:hypothetical protein